MSNELQTQQASLDLEPTDRAAFMEKLGAALGGLMSAEQFLPHMLVSLNDEKFSECTKESKRNVMMDCAANLVLPTLKQVALIARNAKKKDAKTGKDYWVKEVTAMLQWQGYKAIMERHPAILEVQGFLVHKSDQFRMENGDVVHGIDPFDENRAFRSAKDIRGGYVKIVYKDGRKPKYHFVPAAHISKCQGCAQTQDVWNRWYEQMALKTLYRDCYARRAVPVDPMVAQGIEKFINNEDVVLGNDPRKIAYDPPKASIFETTAKPTDEPEPQHEPPQEPTAAPEEQPADAAAKAKNELIAKYVGLIAEQTDPAVLDGFNPDIELDFAGDAATIKSLKKLIGERKAELKKK